jgi:hypothetical protein
VKSAKIVIATSAILLFVIGIYLKIASLQTKGGLVNRYGRWQNSSLPANAVLFFAVVMAGGVLLLIKSERKRPTHKNNDR